jgi:hypothetical protein
MTADPAALLTEPGPPQRSQARPPDPVVHVRLVGRLDTGSCPRLQRAVHELDRNSSRRRFPALVHLDLALVTSLAPAALPLLEEAYLAVERIGGSFWITPPHAAAPYVAFVRAAIRGEFGWARGSAAGR